MWWCAPHYQKGMPHSVARGRSQSIFCTINVLHCTTQALQSFVSCFHKCKSTGYTPQLSFIMAQGWRDCTLVGKFLTRLMERWDIIDHHRESRKAYSLSWPSFLGSTQKPKSPNLWSEKSNKLGLNWTHKGPAEDLGCAVGWSEKHKSLKSKNEQADYWPRHSPNVRTVFEI